MNEKTDWKRIGAALGAGTILGVVCIIGASTRIGGWVDARYYLLSLWMNRFLMGIVIGLAGHFTIIKGSRYGNAALRGFLLGGLLNIGFYIATDFFNTSSFLVGFVYGPLIDLVATWVEGMKEKEN